MTFTVSLTPGGLAEAVRDEQGRPLGLVGRDSLSSVGSAYARQIGYVGASGVPVSIVLPNWADAAEFRSEDGISTLKPSGVSYVSVSDLSRDLGALKVRARYRPVNTGTGARGRWKWKRLFFTPEPSAPYGPLVVTGEPEMSAASSVVGAAVTYEWPSTSRAVTTERRLRLYDAATGGTLVNTITAPTTLPNNPDIYAVPFWRAYDDFTGQWVEREGTTRLQILDIVDSDEIAQGDIAWDVQWQDPAQRILYTVAAVDVAGVGRADDLQARIKCGRYTTAWASCPVRDVAPAVTTWRAFPVIARPAHEVGVNVSEFYPRGQERHCIQFRKRAAGGDWTDPLETKMVAPVPSGALQPTHTVTTAAALNTAIIAAMGQSSAQLIAINADIPGGTSISHSGRVKAGRPLIITQANHATAKKFTLWDGIRVNIDRCENVIFDGLVFDNTGKTVTLGGTDNNGTSYPLMAVPNGRAIQGDATRRIHIVNCTFRHMRVPIRLDYGYAAWVAYNEMVEISEDDIRQFGGAPWSTIEGNHAHDPIIHQAWTGARLTSSYHPDFYQGELYADATKVNRGYANAKILNNRVIGFNGYKAPLQLKTGGNADTDALLASVGHANIIIRDNYFKVNWACSLGGFINAVMDNNVWRRFSGSTANNRLNVYERQKNTKITNTVTSLPLSFQISNSAQGGMTPAQREAEIVGGVTVSATDWPATWGDNGGDRSLVYPHGPMAYAA